MMAPWKLLKLSTDRQSEFLSLPYTQNETRDKFFEIYLKKEENAAIRQTVLSIDMQVKMTRIFEKYAIDRGDGGYQFCPETKSFNHSCVPNADYCWDPDIVSYVVHAASDIKRDEEITYAYIDFWLPREERMAQISKRWGFVCNCLACDISTEFGKASEKRRKRIQEIFHMIKRYWNTARGTDELDFHKMLGYGNLDKLGQAALPLALELHGLLQEEEIVDSSLADR